MCLATTLNKLHPTKQKLNEKVEHKHGRSKSKF